MKTFVSRQHKAQNEREKQPKTYNLTQNALCAAVLMCVWWCLVGSVWIYWNMYCSNTHIYGCTRFMICIQIKIQCINVADVRLSCHNICSDEKVEREKEAKKSNKKTQTTNEMFLLCVKCWSTWRIETFAFSSILAVCLRSGAIIRCWKTHRNREKKEEKKTFIKKGNEWEKSYFNETTNGKIQSKTCYST